MVTINKQKNKMILLGYRHPSIKLYKPQINNKKRGLLIGIVIVCLITPCTNWIVPLMMKGISKLNPLWIYN